MSLKILSQSKEENKHAYNVSSIICHGDKVISGSDDGKIWNQNLELLSELEARGAILSLAAVDDTLYTCANDGSINIWDLNSLKSSGIATTTLVQPQKLFINKESKILWAGDSQGNVAKFENGQETGKFEMVEEIWDMMVGSNPPAIYTARDRDIVVAELISGSKGTRVMVKCTLEGRSPFCVSGNKLCFLDRDGRIINIHENNIEKKFPKIKDVNASDLIVNAVAAGSENVLFSGGYDSTVKKWDLNTFQCAGSINLNNCINAIASNSPDSAFIARSDGVITKVGA